MRHGSRLAAGFALTLAVVAGNAPESNAASRTLAPYRARAMAKVTATPVRRLPAATATPPAGTVNGIPTPPPTPSPPHFGSLDRSIVYTNGVQVLLVPAAGTGIVGLTNLSASPYPFKRPRFSGWQFMYYDRAFYLGDVFGHHAPVAAPTASGEQVYDAWPSPDGQFIAWVLVSPAQWNGMMFSMGASRIVVTDQSGGSARVVLQQPIDANGSVPIIYGWRYGKPPTLLVQNSYGVLGLHKGLEEYSPVMADMVGDWLPPVGTNALPAGEVLGLSPGGQSILYATSDATLPSGEGPFPVALSVMTFAGRKIYNIDVATSHRDKAVPKLPAPSAYVFSRQAYISPDEARVAYTRLDAIYPKGASAPYIRPIASLANIDGSGKSDIAAGFRVAGWTGNHTVVLYKDTDPNAGIYVYDLATRQSSFLVKGLNLQVIGIVP
jgi:hypothetical protein